MRSTLNTPAFQPGDKVIIIDPKPEWGHKFFGCPAVIEEIITNNKYLNSLLDPYFAEGRPHVYRVRINDHGKEFIAFMHEKRMEAAEPPHPDGPISWTEFFQTEIKDIETERNS